MLFKILPQILLALLLLTASAAGAGEENGHPLDVWIETGSLHGETTGAVAVRHDWYGLDFGWLRYHSDSDQEYFQQLYPQEPLPPDARHAGSRMEGVGPGFDLLFFQDLNRNFSLYAGGGAYFVKKDRLYFIPSTGRTCSDGDFTEVRGGYGGGIHWRYKLLLLGFSWHNLRGPSGSLGISFH